MRILALLLCLTAAAWATSRVDSIPVDSATYVDWGGGTADSISMALPDDGYTSVMNTTSSTDDVRFTLGAHSIPEGYTVDSLVLIFNSLTGDSRMILPGLFLSAAYAWGDSFAVTTDWATYRSIPIARPGGGTPTRADLSTIEVVVRRANAGAGGLYVTTWYAIVYSSDGAPVADNNAFNAYMMGGD